jgi:alpha-methylacyl-CoA racemase
MAGPLEGIRIIEMAGLGPAPFCGMMLADHGAEVVLVHRPGAAPDPRDPLMRSRRTVEIDLKSAEGVAQVCALARGAAGLIEGFRPGVMERLGLGPDVLLADNPALVYGRMTGWGQDGPLAQAAGHDINYVALSGTLHAIGPQGEKPVPPINLVGDFGGGGMLLGFGMLAGLLAARSGGRGQVVDCAMTEGAALLATMVWGFRATAGWRDERGVNLLDGGAHFYDTYETLDGRYVALGAIEPQFYRLFRELVGLSEDAAFDPQMDAAHWPDLKVRLTALFRTRTRDAWCALLEGTDVCFAPVLSLEEAPRHPHNRARGAFATVGGVEQPAPAPHYSATPLRAPTRPAPAGDFMESKSDAAA